MMADPEGPSFISCTVERRRYSDDADVTHGTQRHCDGQPTARQMLWASGDDIASIGKIIKQAMAPSASVPSCSKPSKDEPLAGWRYAPSLTASARAGFHSIVGRGEKTGLPVEQGNWRSKCSDRPTRGTFDKKRPIQGIPATTDQEPPSRKPRANDFLGFQFRARTRNENWSARRGAEVQFGGTGRRATRTRSSLISSHLSPSRVW